MREVLVVLALLACVQACVGVTITLQGVEPGETRALPTGQQAGGGISLLLVSDEPFTGEGSTSVSIACNVVGTGSPTWSAPAQLTFYNGMRMSTTGGFSREWLDAESVSQLTCTLTWDADRVDADWNAATLPGEFTFSIDADAGRQVPVLAASASDVASVGRDAYFAALFTLPAGAGGAVLDVQCYYTESDTSVVQHSVHKEVWDLPPLVFAEGANRADTTWTDIPRILAPFRCQFAAQTSDAQRDRLFDSAVVEELPKIWGTVYLQPLATINGLELAGEAPNTHVDFVPGSSKSRVVSVELNLAPTAPIALELKCNDYFTTTLNVLADETNSDEFTLPALPDTATPGSSISCVLNADTTLSGRDSEFDSMTPVNFAVNVGASPSLSVQSNTEGVDFGSTPPPRIPNSISSVLVQVSVDPTPSSDPIAVDMTCVSTVEPLTLRFLIPAGMNTTEEVLSLPQTDSDVTFTCSLSMDTTLQPRNQDFDGAIMPADFSFVRVTDPSGGESGSDSGGSGSGSDSGAGSSTGSGSGGSDSESGGGSDSGSSSGAGSGADSGTSSTGSSSGTGASGASGSGSGSGSESGSGSGSGSDSGSGSGSESGSGSGSGTDSGASGSGSTSNPDAATVVAFLLSKPYSTLQSLVGTLRDGLAAALGQPSSRFALSLQQAEGFEATHTLVRVIIDARPSAAELAATSLANNLKGQIEHTDSELYNQPIYADSTVMWVDVPNSATSSAASLLAISAAAYFALIAAAAI